MTLGHDFKFDTKNAREIPQMVTKDNHLGRIYVSDLGNSRIHTYEVRKYNFYLFLAFLDYINYYLGTELHRSMEN